MVPKIFHSFIAIGLAVTYALTGSVGFALAQPEQAVSPKEEDTAQICHKDSLACQTWNVFRKRFPFHYQTLALTEPESNNKRILIISEPPQAFDKKLAKQHLENLFGSQLVSVELFRHQFGYNAWTEDWVLTLERLHNFSPEKEAQQLQNQIAVLNQNLFGTAYHVQPLLLNSTSKPEFDSPPSMYNAPPNLQVKPFELQTWLLKTHRFKPISIGHELEAVHDSAFKPLKQYLDSGETGSFESEIPTAVVVLVINRQNGLDSLKAEFQKFALNTDAIIGAVAYSKNMLVIAGRKRTSSFEEMPPLRYESALITALESNRELKQGYERKSIMAGKIYETSEYQGWDWAPIYLSDSLIDTEFGSLLNITDQILKSYSFAGTVDYTGFLNYPKPMSYPFHNIPVYKYLNVHELTFNWNTNGLGSITSLGGMQVYALSGTGALPVSYIPDTDTSIKRLPVEQAEEEATAYFQGLRNSALSQVVQYTALYQIFQAFPLKNVSTIKNMTLTKQATESLKRRNSIHRTVWEDSLKYFSLSPQKWEEFAQAYLTGLNENTNLTPKERQLKLQEFYELSQFFHDLHEIEQEFGKDAFHRMVLIWSDPELLASRNWNKASLKASLVSIQKQPQDFKKLDKPSQEQLLALFAFSLHKDYDKLIKEEISSTNMLLPRRRYEQASCYEPGTYIKTPTIVVSNSGSNGGVGGHNLNSNAIRVELSKSVPVGTYKRIGKNKLLLNPSNADAVNEVNQVINRYTSSEKKVQQILRQHPTPMVRNSAMALKTAPYELESNNWLTKHLQSIKPDVAEEFFAGAKQITQEEQYSYVVSQEGQQYLVYQAQPPIRYQFDNAPALFEFAQKMKPGTKSLFKKFDQDSIQSHFKTLQNYNQPALHTANEDILTLLKISEDGELLPLEIHHKGPLQFFSKIINRRADWRRATFKEISMRDKLSRNFEVTLPEEQQPFLEIFSHFSKEPSSIQETRVETVIKSVFLQSSDQTQHKLSDILFKMKKDFNVAFKDNPADLKFLIKQGPIETTVDFKYSGLNRKKTL